MDPVLEYASSAGTRRTPTLVERFITEFIPVRDPSMAIVAGMQIVFGIILLESSIRITEPLFGSDERSTFAMCWYIVQWSNSLMCWSSIVPIPLIGACMLRAKRKWIYGLYIVSWLTIYTAAAIAHGYLATQLTGVWATCMPTSIVSMDLRDVRLNLAFFALIVRMILPGVRLAGPYDPLRKEKTF